MAVKAVIFDIGGVLARDVWEPLLLDKENGVASICDLETGRIREVGQNLWNIFSCRTATKELGWKELESEYWGLLIKMLNLPQSIDFFVQLTDRFIWPIEGMIPIVDRLLTRDIRLAICSDNNEFWSHRQKNKLDFYRFFDLDRVILSCHVGATKSSPGFEMFKEAIRATGVEKEQCVFIDDRIGNIQQATDFGLNCLHFPSRPSIGPRYLEAMFEMMGVL